MQTTTDMESKGSGKTVHGTGIHRYNERHMSCEPLPKKYARPWNFGQMCRVTKFFHTWYNVFYNTDDNAFVTMRRTQVNVLVGKDLYRIHSIGYDKETKSMTIKVDTDYGPMDGPDYNPDWLKIDGVKTPWRTKEDYENETE